MLHCVMRLALVPQNSPRVFEDFFAEMHDRFRGEDSGMEARHVEAA